MKNLKKVLALVLAVVMIMSVVTVASAKTYTDVKATDNYADAIDALSSLKILDGFKDGDNYSFKAEDPFTRAQAAKIVAGALLVAGSVIGLITEVRLFWVKPFYMFIEIYLLVLAFVLVVVGAMVFLIGLVRYRTEMQHLNTANRIEALAALAGAGLFPLFTVLRFLHAYTRPGMAVFIVLLAVAVGLWVWRLAVDCKKLQTEKSHPIAEKD